MNSNYKISFDLAAKFWSDECLALGVRITAPYTLKAGNEQFEYLAFLPDFGGWNGALVCPIVSLSAPPEIRMLQFAHDNGFFVSSINIRGYANRSAPKKVFQNIFEDWGYYGPLEKRPDWYRGYLHKEIEILRAQVIQAWDYAAIALSIKMDISPSCFNGRSTFLMNLPDFGSPRGMILGAMYPPKFDKDNAIEEYANKEKMHCSLLNANDYVLYDEKKFKSILEKFGYYGSKASRPGWLKK